MFDVTFLIDFYYCSASQGGPLRPQYLTLLHVRLPPGFTPNSSVLKPKQVHSAIYENGMLHNYIFKINDIKPSKECLCSNLLCFWNKTSIEFRNPYQY